MKNRTATESPAQLADNLRALIAEAERALAEGGEQTGEHFADLHARLEAARDRVASLYADAREKVVHGAKQADETIRSHPYESLAIALGIGVLLGALLRRGS